MSLNQIIYHSPSDAIDQTLNLKANTMHIKGNLQVPFINGAPYVGGSVNVGDPYDLLQTDSAGLAPEWTNSIKVVDEDISGDLSFSNDSGTTGQFVKKNGSTQEWDNVKDADIVPGAANQVMTTNSVGTLAKWSSSISVDGDLIFNGIYGAPGQFPKKVSGSQAWSNIQAADITPGSDGQVLTTISGTSTWSSISPVNIGPGAAYQIPETNGTATAVHWTSNISPNTILFTGNTLNSQTSLGRYYRTFYDLPVFAAKTSGATFDQSMTTRIEVVIIGTLCHMQINPFTVASLVGTTAPAYIAIQISPPTLLIPNILYTPSNTRQASSFCSTSESFSSNLNPSLANVYVQYYATGTPFIELAKNDGGTYDPNGNHGTGFSGGGGQFMALTAPLSLTYHLIP